MEQRKKVSLEERKKWQSPLPRRKQNPPDLQAKQSRDQKGARGQSTGAASKPPGKGIVGKQAQRKKPGRAKQMAGGEKQAAHHKRPRRVE